MYYQCSGDCENEIKVKLKHTLIMSMNTVRQGLGGEKIVKEHLESMSYGVSLWELEPKIALSAKMKKKCCIVVDTMAWKIGHFIAGNVWPTLN